MERRIRAPRGRPERGAWPSPDRPGPGHPGPEPEPDMDVYDVIREIVPPPPQQVSHFSPAAAVKSSIQTGIPFLESSSEQLYTRRPSEETILLKCRNQLFSATSTQNNLEELLVEIVCKNKYSHENDIVHLILLVMNQWGNEILIQRNALACLVHLSNHNAQFCLPPKQASNIIKVLKTSKFSLDESILRSSVKLFQNNKILEDIEDKLELVYILLNALCHISGVDDILVFTKGLVKYLQPYQKKNIRESKPLVKLLVEFPFRKNDKITVPLCWSALDILLILAECDTQWETLISVEGTQKLRHLSGRPELKDKCDAILRIVTSASDSEDVICLDLDPSSSGLSHQNVPQTRKHVQTSVKIPETSHLPRVSNNAREVDPSTIDTASESIPTKHDSDLSSKTHSALYAWMPPTEGRLNHNKPPNNSSQEHVFNECKQLISDGRVDTSIFLPIDAELTRNAPTPPPQADVSDDIDVQFSDDEMSVTYEKPAGRTHRYTPLLSQSPSYSPPTTPPNLKENSNILSLGLNNLNPGQNNIYSQPSKLFSTTNQSPLGNKGQEEHSSSRKRKIQLKRRLRSGNKSSKTRYCLCIFCKEPNDKQVLLTKQLRQMHPFLLNPSLSDLLKCLNSHLCKHHCI